MNLFEKTNLMTTKSVSAHSRTSRNTIDDNRSVSSRYIKEAEKVKLPPAAREATEKFQLIMSNLKKNINKLFLNDDTKKQVELQYANTYQAGLNICKLGPKNFTDENVSSFFSEWSDLSDILYNYFDFDPKERFTQYIDEITKKIINIVQPINIIAFDDSYPAEAKKAKQAKADKDSFDNSMSLLSKQTYKFFKGKLSIDTFIQTIKQLISNVTSYKNLYFHQPREEATDILYLTQTYLNRILDAVYDFYGDEKSFNIFNSRLIKSGEKLEILFKNQKKNDSNDELPEDIHSDNEKNNEEEDEIDKIFTSKNRNPPKVSFDNANHNDNQYYSENEEEEAYTKRSSNHKIQKNDKEKKQSNNNENIEETEEQLRAEISELKQSINTISKKISNINRKRAAENEEDDDIKSKKIDLSFSNDYLSNIIKYTKELNEETQNELESLQSLNTELDNIFGTKNKYNKQPFNSSTKKIKGEINNLDDKLQTFSDELTKYQQKTSRSLKIRASQSNKDDIMRAIIELNVQNKGIESSIGEIEETKKKLIQEEEKLGTSENPSNQTLNDMMNFLDSHKKELNEIENYFENSEPIQNPEKISQELEVYRDDKYVSDINDDYLKTKKELEKARSSYDSCLSQFNDSINKLLKYLTSEDKDTIELFRSKLDDKENEEFEASYSSLCKVREEMIIKYSLKNKMDTIKNWLDNNFPQYDDHNLSIEQKLELILQEVKSHNPKR